MPPFPCKASYHRGRCSEHSHCSTNIIKGLFPIQGAEGLQLPFNTVSIDVINHCQVADYRTLQVAEVVNPWKRNPELSPGTDVFWPDGLRFASTASYCNALSVQNLSWSQISPRCLPIRMDLKLPSQVYLQFIAVETSMICLLR